MKKHRIKILFLILLELVLSRGALFDDRNNEISADVKDVIKAIGSVLSKNIDEDGESKKIQIQILNRSSRIICLLALR
jgi:hypothetical protein